MQTKNKVVKHLNGGDRLVLVNQASFKPHVLPVIGVDEYDNEANLSSSDRQRGPWVVVQTTYETTEPDGAGGQKVVSHKSGILYRADENVQIVAS